MRTQAEFTQSSPESTRILLRGIWGHLTRRRRIQLAMLLLVMLSSGVAELVSLGAVIPFLAVLTDPEQLWQQPLVEELSSWLGFQQATELLVLLLPITFAAAALLAALVRLTNLWLNGRLAAALGSDLSCEVYRRTLYQPYEVHVQRNSAEVITATTSQIGQTVAALNSLLQLITSAVVAAGLLTGLLLIDAPVAVAAALLFGTAYAVLAVSSRRELRCNGQKITEASRQQIKALQEGLGAIRDVLLDGSQATYLRTYQKADRPQRQYQAKNTFLAAFPRYAIEALGMVAIALFGMLLVLQRGSGAAVIPILGAMALGAQRLLPALQQIYSGWASLKGYNAAIHAVLEILNQAVPPTATVTKPLPLRECIRLEKVHFSYESDQLEVLKGLDLEIRSGERIGLIGSTGSGKSTMVDLLMGLLAPKAGRVLVDGKNLHDSLHPERLIAWRASIAHVPQTIYLADSSIAENIAFGVPRHQIDLARVKRAAKQAQISSFIESSSEGYESFVGEHGIRLSGGQRQRLGIARALYKEAMVLVFDEATSALDAETEEAVMQVTNSIRNSLTVIMIAHRLGTLKGCDRIVRLSRGIITEEGPPQAVLP